VLVAIVDDSPMNLRLMEGLVRKTGEHRVQSFEYPLEGIAWCGAHEPDLLIVDYMMPELDGLAFITRFRDLPKRDEVPVLMITADQDQEVRYQALDGGATDFLTKPIDAHEFRARVRNMLALRANQRQVADLACFLADRNEWLNGKVQEATAEIQQRNHLLGRQNELLARRQTEILDREREMITRLSRAAEFRDPETGAHIQRMAHYSRLIADGLGLPGEEQEILLRAAPMHDVGKIAIPDDILRKPGRLTAEEFEVMKRHARYGYDILSGSQSTLLDTAAVIALSHHEKYDGSGYPQGLAGDGIPLYGRIVAVADVFDALTTERPYKNIWELDDALRFLKDNAGIHFDPGCVQAFLARLDQILAARARYQDASPAHGQQ
jgi:two-component system, response regulator RpfG